MKPGVRERARVDLRDRRVVHLQNSGWRVLEGCAGYQRPGGIIELDN